MKAASKRNLPRGVYKAPAGKFISKVQWNGMSRYIGTFDTPEQASVAYNSVKNDLEDAKISAFSANAVDAIFDEAKKKALGTL